MDTLNTNIKREIIKQKLEHWKQTLYSFELDAKVAKTVDDDQMLNRVKTQVKTAIAAIELLKSELEQLDNEK